MAVVKELIRTERMEQSALVTMSLHRSLNYQTISIRAICIK